MALQLPTVEDPRVAQALNAIATAFPLTTQLLVDEVITVDKIVQGTITGDRIAAGTITGDLVAAGTIEGTNIKAGTITAAELDVSELSAISADLGTITAGFLEAVMIKASTFEGNTFIGETIEGGTLTGVVVVGATIATALSGARVEMDLLGIRGINASAVEKFSFDTASGVLTATAVISAEEGSTIPTSVLTGQIVETQIEDDSISTPKLQANSVTAAEIDVAELSAITADLGIVTAGTLKTVELEAATGDFSGEIHAEGFSVESDSGPEIINTIRWLDGASLDAWVNGGESGGKFLRLGASGTIGAEPLLNIGSPGVPTSNEIAVQASAESDYIILQRGDGASSFLQLSSTRKERDFGIVTALPGSPSLGDRCQFKAATGIYWHLVYTGEETYPWAKVGGPPLLHEITTAQETAATGYADLATKGPEVTVPLGGEYDIEIGCYAVSSGGSQAMRMSYAIGGTGATDADACVLIRQETSVGGGTASSSRTRRKAFAKGTLLRAAYKTSAGTATFQDRRMQLDPVRVG